jgi:peptidoglycan hydrolase-like protein with peptidoglycan-binding domain
LQLRTCLAAASAALLIAGSASTLEAATKRTTSKTTVRGKSGKAKPRARRARGPARQAAPTAERYREIQQVLTDQGFYTGSINGEWGADSVAALKKFQASKGLVPDGKLGALSLIALGLGPKHESVADVAARPASEPPAGP